MDRTPAHACRLLLTGISLVVAWPMWAEAKHENRDPVGSELAPRFLGYLSTEASQQADRGVELVDALLVAWNPGKALELCRQINGYQRAIAAYRTSVQFARQRNREEARAAMALASTSGSGALDHEIQEIASTRALALAATGNFAGAEATCEPILSEAIRVQSLASLFEFMDLDGAEAKAKAFADGPAARFPSEGAAALLWVGIHLADHGKMDDARRLMVEAVQTIQSQGSVSTVPLIRRAVDGALACGDVDLARQWAQVALTFAARTHSSAYWKPHYLKLSAEAFMAAGDVGTASKILDAIPDTVGQLDFHAYSRGGMGAAEAFLLRGDTANFHKAAVHVLRQMRQHPHHRARGMSAIDVLAAYVRAGISLPEEVVKELEETARSIETDPAFINPV